MICTSHYYNQTVASKTQQTEYGDNIYLRRYSYPDIVLNEVHDLKEWSLLVNVNLISD